MPRNSDWTAFCLAALMAAILAAGLWLAGEPLHPAPAFERTQE